MEKAYILIGCELGAENEIVGKILRLDKVKDARVVYGDYDIVVEAETDTESQMDNLITKKIRKIGKVRSTMTLGVVN
ncbi:MAG: Lrp/AsnC family transcriptional regulator [Thaumarchaeota archaeon]|nr:MAG: AsnC family transcriptional regulator [Thaumarchaeota archaeon 13_1_40CM_4_38_7]OLD40641.1 MAG: AsnC family transcriptional regulator [Thaumarchaeota archaeon 13_1_40CM_2_39_4]TLY04394.1 MAG: Lrp/AsnC family transcriptional regulator [Nitrososphaerota archaeon]TLY07197.1 MAG: Lrp/AsnC family transcriptional regulator [Nitrososphaerota archaeon]